MTNYIINISKYIIYIGFAALFFVTPLILTPINSELFEFNKMMFVYAVVVVISASWIIREIYNRGNQGDWGNQGNKKYRNFLGFRVRKTPLDIPIFFFLVSQIVATIFSIDPHVSIWGYYSRQNGGLLSTVSYIVLFYAFVSNIGEVGWNPGDKGDQGNEGKRGDKRQAIHFMKRLALLGIASGFLVAVYGILQHFGIDKDIWVQDVVNRVFSSLGQPNWLAAYMGVLSFVALGIGIRGGNRGDRAGRGNRGVRVFGGVRVFRDYFWVGLVAVYYLTILYTKSRSGLLGFWVGNGLFWGLVGIGRIRRIGQIRRIFLTFNFALLTFNFIFGVPAEKVNRFLLPGIIQRVGESKVERIVIDQGDQPRTPRGAGFGNQGTAIETGGTESGEIRKYVWQAAVNAWKENPLFGTGVETFAWAFYRYKPVEHNLTSEWDFLYNKAHNEYLNFLATSGVVGLGSYLLVIGVFGIWVFREFRGFRDKKKPELRITNYELLSIGLFAAWASILVTDFFGFSVVVTSLYFWLIPGFIFAYGELSTQNQSKHGSGQAVDPEPERARFGAGRRPSTSGDIGHIRRIGLIGTGGIVVLAAVYLLFILGKYWYADVLYARGKRYLKAGYSLQADQVLSKAIDLRPGEPVFWDELGFLKGTLAIEAYERQEATRAAELVASSLDLQGKALKISPQNLNFVKTRVKLYYALSEIFDSEAERTQTPQIDTDKTDRKEQKATPTEISFLKLAIEMLELGRELAPNDPKILYNLALLQASQEGQEEQEGQEGEKDKKEKKGVAGAIETLEEALKMKPDYRDGRIALGLFYQQEGELDKAREQFEYILEKINPEDEEAQRYLNEL